MKIGSDSSLRGCNRHFMCTLLGEMVLVRTEGHRCQDHTENDLAKQLKFRNSYKVGPQ